MLFSRIVGPFPIVMFFGTETNPLPQPWTVVANGQQFNRPKRSLVVLDIELAHVPFFGCRNTSQLNVYHFWTPPSMSWIRVMAL